MNRGDLSEQFVSGEEIFRGGILRLRRDVVRLPDGSQAVREYVRHPGAVAIVALTGEGGVVLERQHRYPLGRDFVELPAGKLEPDEAHLETAQRELLEETGFAAELWQALGSFTANGNYGCGKVHLLYAQRACKVVEPASGDLEEMEILEMRPSELLEAMKQGKVSLLGAAAAVALAYAHNRPKL